MRQEILKNIVSIILSTIIVIAIGQYLDRHNALDNEGKGPQGAWVCSRWYNSYTCDFDEFVKNHILLLPFEIPFILIGTGLIYQIISFGLNKCQNKNNI